jgi:hypothetical protein
LYILPNAGQLASKLQGDRIETPTYIKEQKLKIDYKYYIEHQIYNPITQLFGLFVDQIPGYVKPTATLCIEEKEHYAGDLLFKSIYERCDKQIVRNFANRFGFQVKPQPQEKQQEKQVQPILAQTSRKKQATINFQKLDRYLIEKHDEEKRKKKKAEKNVVEVQV